jgi:C-terminal processing protease CtpA/Prc
MTKQVIKLINEVILLNGIKKYIDNWIPMNINKNFKNSQEFLTYIIQHIKIYHKHSNLLTLTYYQNINKLPDNRKPPKFFWDKKMKIGRIIFYHFYTSNTNNDIKDEVDMIKITNNYLEKWLNNKMKGLIIDLRYHKGGNFYPFIKSLNHILGNTSLFSISKEKIENKKNINWINNQDNELVISKNHNSKLKFKNPIAIIIGDKTKSSGEFSASLFYGRENVKFFGNNSGGFLSMNSTITINNKLKLIIPVNLVTTVDYHFHDKELIEPDVYSNKPINDSKIWINNYSKVNNHNIGL